MSVSATTWCDICNPTQTRNRDGRGYAEMPRKAAQDQGWMRRGGMDICLACQDDMAEGRGAFPTVEKR